MTTGKDEPVSAADTARTGAARTDTAEAEEGELRSQLAAMARLSSSLTLEATMTRIAEYAASAIPGAEGAGVTLLELGHPVTIVASTPFVRDVDAIQYGIGEGPCISAAAYRITVRSGSLGTDPQWTTFGSQVKELGVHSVLSLPLLLADPASPTVGAINVYAHPADSFTDRAQRLGELFAGPAAIAIRSAQILFAARQVVALLQAELPERAIIDQAIGVLTARTGVTAAQARTILHKSSTDLGQTLLHTATGILTQAQHRAGLAPMDPSE